MTTNATAKTGLRVVEQAFHNKDDVPEPTTLRLVLSGVVVAAMLFAAFILDW